MAEIGVIMDKKEQVSSLDYGCKIAIYEQRQTDWIKNRELVVDLPEQYCSDYMNLLRIAIGKLITELQDCNVLLGAEITGLPYMMLDHAGFMLCEAQTLTDELLHIIWNDHEMAEQKPEGTIIQEEYPVAPFEIDCGIYEMDLRKLAKVHPDISSKMALIPFLKNHQFDRLDVYCDHIMPWLDQEVVRGRLSYQSKSLKDSGYKVEISYCLKK